MELIDELLVDVKIRLDITWSDENTDKKLKGIIQQGIGYINRIAGKKLNFGEAESTETTYEEMLMQALQDFKEDRTDIPGAINMIKAAEKTKARALEQSNLGKALLYDYCRYVRSNAFEMFQKNYEHELLALQMDTEVEEHEAKANNADI